MSEVRPNRITPEGWQLGKEIARLCDGEAERKGRDGRCWTCAFRAGDHLANGSPETLMSAMKSAAERTPFWCHERDQPCAGWVLMRAEAGDTREMPWEHVAGAECDSDGSGEAIETGTGSTVGDSAGPKDIAQTTPPYSG